MAERPKQWHTEISERTEIRNQCSEKIILSSPPWRHF